MSMDLPQPEPITEHVNQAEPITEHFHQAEPIRTKIHNLVVVQILGLIRNKSHSSLVTEVPRRSERIGETFNNQNTGRESIKHQFNYLPQFVVR